MNLKHFIEDSGVRKSALIYNCLKESILEFYLPPQSHLSEEAMRVHFQVSRSMIREVFIKLAQDGLLEIIPQKGTYVSLIDLRIISETLFIRYTLEKTVLTTGISSFDKSRLLDLSQYILIQEESNDVLSIVQSDNNFHRTIFEGSGVLHVWKILEKSQLQYDRLRVLALQKHATQDLMINDHKEIKQAIISQDIKPIEKIYQNHLQSFHNLYASVIEEFSHYFTGDIYKI